MSIFTIRKNSKRVAQVQVPQRTVTYNHIYASGQIAEQMHSLIKVAKKQGVKVTGGYKHTLGEINSLDVTFTGPVNVVNALDNRLSDIYEDFRWRR